MKFKLAFGADQQHRWIQESQGTLNFPQGTESGDTRTA